jgi:hypothetical protein
VDDEAPLVWHSRAAAGSVRPHVPVGFRAWEVVVAPAPLRNDLYERLVDRLRHAEQYAKAARGTAEEARAAYSAEHGEVVAMTAAASERLADQLRRVEEYAEAAARTVHDALGLLEGARRERRDD